MKPIVIIGSGIAGYTLVKSIRMLDNKKPIVLITKDKGDYYSKPMLSNAFNKNQPLDDLVLMSGKEMAKNYLLELRHNCVVETVDTNKKFVNTNQGTIEYEKLVLACGAMPRKLPLIPNSPNIFSINHLDDYRLFRMALTNKRRIVILGSGLIGCEFANDLASAGFHVTIVSIDKYPLQAFLPEDIGLKLKQQLSLLEVNWHLATQMVSITSGQEVFEINLNNGKILMAELILSAIGLEPNICLAKKSGILTNKGIITDDYLKTSHSSVYALGDCAEINGRLWPFISPIRQCGPVLAKTLLGNPTRVSLSNLMITVKTPIYPISFCGNLDNQLYQPQSELTDEGIKVTYSSLEKKLKGFILTNKEVLKSSNLLKQMA